MTSTALHVADDAALDQQIEHWFHWDKNEMTKTEIQNLINTNDVAALHARLMNRLVFGTAGMRGQMGAGFAFINDLTIIQTTQGLLKYLQQQFPDLCERGVVIGYDGRHNSQRFSWLTGNIFIKANVPVYWFSRVNPTPFVAFAVTHYNSACGIMITASHNPKKDNGYKVYWSNGAQICEPRDRLISESILENLAPWCTSWDVEGIDASPLKSDPLEDVLREYCSGLIKSSFCQELVTKSSVRFAYTAMHGVGYYYVQHAMKAWGFSPPIPVPKQIEPDPDFPTVKYPNPEEGKGALALAIATATEQGCPIILANDPDVDRFAVAEIQQDGQWKIFSGNETGTLLGWWLWHNYKLNNPQSSGEDVYMLASTVSSKILRSMSEVEGFQFIETLTGFKWMGNKADDLVKDGKTVLFAFEEAIGFMVGSDVLDKDGISALCCVAELACYLYDQGENLNHKLNCIYEDYGYHTSQNSYYICHRPDIIKIIFDNMRNCNTRNKYPDSCGGYGVKSIRDLTAGYDSSTKDEQPVRCDLNVLPVDPKTQMITLIFNNGCEVTLRTSGTEPKIKYYSELILPRTSELTRKEAETLNEGVVAAVVEELLQPNRYCLVPRVE